MPAILNDEFTRVISRESFRDRCFGASQWCQDAEGPFVSLCFQRKNITRLRCMCVCLHVELNKRPVS